MARSLFALVLGLILILPVAATSKTDRTAKTSLLITWKEFQQLPAESQAQLIETFHEFSQRVEESLEQDQIGLQAANGLEQKRIYAFLYETLVDTAMAQINWEELDFDKHARACETNWRSKFSAIPVNRKPGAPVTNYLSTYKYTCLYGGNPRCLTYENGRIFCERPEKKNCTGNLIGCEGFQFVHKNGGTLCVTSGAGTTARCRSNPNGKTPAQIAEHYKTMPGAQTRFESYERAILRYCSSPNPPPFNVEECGWLVSRTREIRAALATHPPAEALCIFNAAGKLPPNYPNNPVMITLIPTTFQPKMVKEVKLSGSTDWEIKTFTRDSCGEVVVKHKTTPHTIVIKDPCSSDNRYACRIETPEGQGIRGATSAGNICEFKADGKLPQDYPQEPVTFQLVKTDFTPAMVKAAVANAAWSAPTFSQPSCGDVTFTHQRTGKKVIIKDPCATDPNRQCEVSTPDSRGLYGNPRTAN